VTTLAIKASGMVTSVGFNAPATCAAIRAGIRNVNETNLWDAESGSYLAAGKVDLPHW
jgi:3-oxoacyl-[acyl-carrier-protein] synthase-1